MNLVDVIEKGQMQKEVPEVRPGDTVRVHMRIVEGEKERIQVIEGVIIKIHGGANRKTITVRKISFGVGVERIFPVYSPRVEKIEVTKHARVRRARLYYLRELRGKAARLKEIKKAPTEKKSKTRTRGKKARAAKKAAAAQA